MYTFYAKMSILSDPRQIDFQNYLHKYNIIFDIHRGDPK